MKKYRQLPLYTKILIGMLAGIAIGYLFVLAGQSSLVSN